MREKKPLKRMYKIVTLLLVIGSITVGTMIAFGSVQVNSTISIDTELAKEGRGIVETKTVNYAIAKIEIVRPEIIKPQMIELKAAKPKVTEGYYVSEASDWIAAQYVQAAGVTVNGHVIAVGQNDCGECNTIKWKNIVAISMSNTHTLGLKKDYTVIAAGNNDAKQCEVSKWSDIVAIAAATNISYGLKKDGKVVTTDISENDFMYFEQDKVQHWRKIVDISAGNLHVVGLKSDGTVIAAGYNYNHQCDVSSWTNIKKVYANADCTFGITYDGEVKVAGTFDTRIDLFAVETWSDIVQVTTAGSVAYGLKSDGTIIMTKYEGMGVNEINASTVSKWKNMIAIAAGNGFIIGLKSDGTIVHEGFHGIGLATATTWSNIGNKYYKRIIKGGTKLKAAAEPEDENAVAPMEDFVYEPINEEVNILLYVGDSESVNIPLKINGLRVTSIGNSAFANCNSIKKLTIPDSVTTIGESAFSRCINMRSVNIPKGVTKIEANTFFLCDSLEKITIPDSVISIGESAFYECHRIISIKFPKEITSIADFVCKGCYKLKSVTIPKGVTIIGEEAFSWCHTLKVIKLSNTVKSIEKGAFDFCSENFVVQGQKESYAETYAKEKIYIFKAVK